MLMRFVGGPLDGREEEASGCRMYVVPDAKDIAYYTREDGTTGLLFGQHTYKIKFVSVMNADGSCEHWSQYEYAGYRRPQ
jgi:hypothetical protein